MDWGQDHPQVNLKLQFVSVDEDSIVFIVTPPVFTGFTNAIYKIESSYQATFTIDVENQISIYKIDTSERISFIGIEAEERVSIYSIETSYGSVVAVTGGYGVGPYGMFPYGT